MARNEIIYEIAKRDMGEQFNENQLCIRCGKNAHDNCYSIRGHREVSMSGFCEKCFDEIMKTEEDCDEDS